MARKSYRRYPTDAAHPRTDPSCRGKTVAYSPLGFSGGVDVSAGYTSAGARMPFSAQLNASLISYCFASESAFHRRSPNTIGQIAPHMTRTPPCASAMAHTRRMNDLVSVSILCTRVDRTAVDVSVAGRVRARVCALSSMFNVSSTCK